MPLYPPKTRCVERKIFLLGAGAVTLLGAVTQGTQTAPKWADESHGAVRAGQDVILKSVKVFQNNDGNADGLVQWFIVSFNWTNNLGYVIAPKITHWTIIDTENQPWTAADGGSTQLIGMPSYYDGQLQRGESHDFTVAFHLSARMVGTLFYDASY
jgi:hypothetical protein